MYMNASQANAWVTLLVTFKNKTNTMELGLHLWFPT
jgi:hypothetical protein